MNAFTAADGTAAPAPVLSSLDLVFRAALLAGLGPHAQALTATFGVAQAGADARTCVDGGNGLLLLVSAPGGRSLQLLRRAHQADQAGLMRWTRSAYAGRHEHRRSTIAACHGEMAAAWEYAVALARATGHEDALRLRQSLLGWRGSIFSAEQPAAAGQPALITWRLDRQLAPQAALEACGMGAAWPAAEAAIAALTGRPVWQRIGPWSIACSLDGARVRLGSSLWARMPEGPAKARGMAAVVEQFGGDGRFAEGLYRLIADARPGRVVGRAVELELSERGVIGAEFYLAVPELG